MKDVISPKVLQILENPPILGYCGSVLSNLRDHPSTVARRLLPTGEANGREKNVNVSNFAGSSNGRIDASEAFHLGSNPSPAALRHFVPQGLRQQTHKERRRSRTNVRDSKENQK